MGSALLKKEDLLTFLEVLVLPKQNVQFCVQSVQFVQFWLCLSSFPSANPEFWHFLHYLAHFCTNFNNDNNNDDELHQRLRDLREKQILYYVTAMTSAMTSHFTLFDT